MNNKVHDGEDGETGDGDKILPVATTRQQERERQRKMWFYLYTAAILQFVLGVLIMVLNIIFIYDGMNSKWYGQPGEPELNDDGEMVTKGGGLKVASIGEGIIAGKNRSSSVIQKSGMQ